MASENLTITITGPQGCGKSLLADWVLKNLPRVIRSPYHERGKALGHVTIVDGEGDDRQVIDL